MQNLRLKAGIIIVALQWLLWLVIPNVIQGPWTRAVGVLGGLLGGLVMMVWWTFFSRAPRLERWTAIPIWILALLGAYSIADESIATGMQGMMFFAYAIPVLCLAFILWAIISKRLSVRIRRVSMLFTILMACGVWTLLRSEGMTGDSGIDVAWRWSETAEERLLSQEGNEQFLPAGLSMKPGTVAQWPGFRGGDRNSIISGLRIESDWKISPPLELWRRPVGPGCSSFAVQGELLFTQEQRGDDEVVSCYKLLTGEPVWSHHDRARFWDSHAGAGPRSTPTLLGGKVYSLGATGILNVLDAGDGSSIWTRNALNDAGVELSEWGLAASPLVVGDVVIVALNGKLAAYDIASGDPVWFGPDGGESWSSPHLFRLEGIEQVVMMSKTGATAFQHTDGKVLWEYKWEGGRIVQPSLCENGDLLISAGGATGIGRISVTNESGEWIIQERWTSIRLRPNFNDFVIHKGFAYGFDGLGLACIELEEGNRKWKGGRFGGQILLLADQDLLLVLTEKGELALLEAIPDRLSELARFPAIEGKTWNHPAMAGDILLVRNMEEMTAFRLPVK